MPKRVEGIGPAQADICIVGEAAGEEEERLGLPFVGKSGKLLDGLLADVGINRAACYITNLVKEHPPYNDISPWFKHGQFTVLGREAATALLREIGERRPVVVVALGNPAKAAITSDVRGITQIRGTPFRVGGAICIPSIHPAAILRGAWMDKYLLAADLRKARRIVEGAEIPTRNLRIHPTLPEALQYIKDCAVEAEIGFDIENAPTEMTCFSLAQDPLDAMSISLHSFKHGARDEILEALRELLESASGPRIVTQNGNYDTSFLAEFHHIHTNLERVEDTMCAHHVLLADLGGDEKEKADGTVVVKRSSKSLALLASLYTLEPYYKDEGKRGRAEGDLDTYLRYNAKDAAVTLECWQVLAADLAARPGMMHTYRELTMKRLPAVQAMQTSGLRVDLKAYAQLRLAAEEKVKLIDAELQEEVWDFLLSRRKTPAILWSRAIDAVEIGAGFLASLPKNAEHADAIALLKVDLKKAKKHLSHARTMLRASLKPFNPDSSDQCQELFYVFYGLHQRTNRKTGAATVDDAALAEFSRPTSMRPGIRAASLIQAIREQRQQIETYLGWELDGPGGDRFRASFNLRGTKFGRMSSSKLFFRLGSNQQNIPPSVRVCMLADAPFERAA